MSLHDYRRSAALADADEPFYGLVMAAMRRADTDNARKLAQAFPEAWHELQARYASPGGRLESDAAIGSGIV